MDARRESDPVKNRTTIERKSERELVVTRTVNAPARLVFEAWTTAELFRRWWVPRSYGLNLLSCEMDVRVGLVRHRTSWRFLRPKLAENKGHMHKAAELAARPGSRS